MQQITAQNSSRKRENFGHKMENLENDRDSKIRLRQKCRIFTVVISNEKVCYWTPSFKAGLNEKYIICCLIYFQFVIK